MNRLGILRNFPTEPERVVALAETLKMLCKDEGELHRLVSEWCEHSEYSPTEAGLRSVLADIRAGEVPESDAKAAKCPLCGGTGYSETFWLQTIERRNDSNYRTKQTITKQQYDTLRRKLDPANWDQQVYSGEKHCDCPIGLGIRAAINSKLAEAEAKAHGVRS